MFQPLCWRLQGAVMMSRAAAGLAGLTEALDLKDTEIQNLQVCTRGGRG